MHDAWKDMVWTEQKSVFFPRISLKEMCGSRAQQKIPERGFFACYDLLMIEFLRPLNIPRAFLSAIITLGVIWVYGLTVDRVLWMFVFDPLASVLPGFIFYGIAYACEFFLICGLLLIASVFYFYRVRVNVSTSAVLGLALAISLYISESIQNKYETFTDPNGYVHIGHISIFQSLLLVVGVMVFVGTVHYFKPATFASATN